MSFWIIIPARYAATRLPGKPLCQLLGKSLIQHVYERAKESGAERILIATDDQRILDEANQFGAEVYMTAEHHRSGTERSSELIEQLNIPADQIIVNLQGDEPCVPASLLKQVAQNLSVENVDMATLCEPIDNEERLRDPNVVKVVRDKKNRAIYFSRSIIPFDRSGEDLSASLQRYDYRRHIGIYAYRAQFIKTYLAWPVSPLEELESLEQLRVLWHGGSIHVDDVMQTPGPGVDVEADRVLAEKWLAQNGVVE